MSFVGKLGASLAKILLPLGGRGLFVAAALDSSFIPLPEGVDLWLITLSIWQPARMPFFVICSTLGSLLGCSMLYIAVRWSEETFVENNPKYKGLPRVQRLVEKYEFLALLVGAVLPPPTPFKLVVIAAGLVKGRFEKFLLALAIGRSIRYAGEAVLAVHYGRRVWSSLLRVGPVIFGLVVAAFVIDFFRRRFQARTV